ncbi:SMC-Scp complex subunit ScpB [Candidatus Woesearchaeota archaeon]|nr:SMC-Scp complex subunit ScpB [Candidatus Woesearchaeota archaeon]
MSELKNRLEAILFASGKGVSETDLVEFTSSKPKEVKKALQELQEDYEKRDTSLAITEVESKWKLSVIGKYTNDIQKIVSETELPKPILKTLAVVAYKSPVLQSDIIHMRGQGAYDHIKVLVKQKLITKEEEGRSYILKITDKFYNYFDVEGDEDIKDVFKQLRNAHQEKLGNLKIVDLEKDSEEENTQTIGDLEIIDIEPKTAKRTPEELAEEQDFLKRMELNLSEVSKRVDGHELPQRNTHPELEKEQKTIDATTTSLDDVKKAMDEEKEKERKLKEDNENPLEELEKFVSGQEEEEEEDLL